MKQQEVKEMENVSDGYRLVLSWPCVSLCQYMLIRYWHVQE